MAEREGPNTTTQDELFTATHSVTPSDKETLILIDGHALVHRAFHALPEDLKIQKTGELVNATFGFTRMLLATLRERQPTYLAVVFDRSAPTFRHIEFTQYKAQRAPTSELLHPQFKRVRQVVETLNIPIYEKDGFEGDDIIGTLSRQATGAGLQTLVLTGDLDALQLVSPAVTVLVPRRGISDVTMYDEAAVLARYGFPPDRIPDYKALTGDSSDNIPKIPSIGEKTAAKLLIDYGSLEGILDHVDELQPPKLRPLFKEYAEQARKSKYLATIVTTVPIQLNIAASRARSYDRAAVLALFRELEFNSLVQELPPSLTDPAPSPASGVPAITNAVPPRPVLPALTRPAARPASPALVTPGEVEQLALFGAIDLGAEDSGGSDTSDTGEAPVAHTPVITSLPTLQALVKTLSSRVEWTFGVDTSSLDALQSELEALNFWLSRNETYHIPLRGETAEELPLKAVLAQLKPVLENAHLPKYAHNGTFDVLVLSRYDVEIKGLIADTTDTLVIDSLVALQALVSSLANKAGWAFDTETTSTNALRADLVGISFSLGKSEAYYIPVGHKTSEGTLLPRQLPLETVLAHLKPVLENARIPKYAHNIKYDLLVFARYGIWVQGLAVDTMIAAYLLNPGERGLGLKEQAFERLGIEMTNITELIGKGAKQTTMDQIDIRPAANYAGADADVTYRLVDVLLPELAQQELLDLFNQVEMPLVPVLAKMEQAGIAVDGNVLKQLKGEMEAQIAQLEKAVYLHVGHEFNINSPKQLGDVLFVELKLPSGRRTKTGYSTDNEVLEGLRGTNPVVDQILEVRQLTKLRGTYLDGLLKLMDPQTGRVHTSFNQTIASTGRLSSAEPNLQNIPIRTQVGRNIRKAFIAAPGCQLLAADYSQIELRILAHVSQDERLLEAFAKDEDIHMATAATIQNIPLSEVTPDMRRLAKTVNFGVIYGQTAYGLSRVAGISPQQAAEFISSYYKLYAGIRLYLERTRSEAFMNGYVKTLLNRRRYMPDLQSENQNVRQTAQREALNMPVQGTAADIIKIAMIRLQDQLDRQNLKTRLLLQVHDELVLEAPDEEIEQVAKLVCDIMEGAMQLSVPLKVDVKAGRNWYDVEQVSR